MDVILFRHAEAGDRDPAMYGDDDLRPVTPGGERKMTAAARALQTASILQNVFELRESAQVNEALGHACTPSAVVQLLAKLPPDARIALVGHEPALSAVAAAMIGPSADARIVLKKGGCIGIGFDGTARLGTGALMFLFKPGQLKKLGH